jgi:hypothetical protein
VQRLGWCWKEKVESSGQVELRRQSGGLLGWYSLMVFVVVQGQGWGLGCTATVRKVAWVLGRDQGWRWTWLEKALWVVMWLTVGLAGEGAVDGDVGRVEAWAVGAVNDNRGVTRVARCS